MNHRSRFMASKPKKQYAEIILDDSTATRGAHNSHVVNEIRAELLQAAVMTGSILLEAVLRCSHCVQELTAHNNLFVSFIVMIHSRTENL
jgi:hypothetical protein